MHSRTGSFNVQQDIPSAKIVWESGIPITFVPSEVTHRLWFEGDAFERLLHADDPPAVAMVGRMLREWVDFRSDALETPIKGTCPHDPMTLCEAVYPGMFVRRWFRGTLTMHSYAFQGFCTFVADARGPHWMPFAEALAEKGLFEKWMAERLFEPARTDARDENGDSL